MKQLEASLVSSLQAARDGGIAPVYFLWVEAKSRSTGAIEAMGLWSGDEDITVTVRTPDGGLTSRAYIGGTNLSISGLQYEANLTDVPITASMSQVAPATQQLVRGTEVRLAYCDVHGTTWSGGVFTSTPDILWVGIVDDAQIGTPEVGGSGNIGLTIRSEIMSQLTSVNPVKSSDSHQNRRDPDDRFSEYGGTIRSRSVQWFVEND